MSRRERARKALALARREHDRDLRRARSMAMLDGDQAEAHRIAIELYGEDAADLMRAEGIARCEGHAARQVRDEYGALLRRLLERDHGWKPGRLGLKPGPPPSVSLMESQAKHLREKRPDLAARLRETGVGEDWLPADPATLPGYLPSIPERRDEEYRAEVLEILRSLQAPKPWAVRAVPPEEKAALAETIARYEGAA